MPCYYTPYICRLCGETDKIQFYKSYLTRCKKCILKKHNQRHRQSGEKQPFGENKRPAWYLLNIVRVRVLQAKNRAQSKGLPFDLTTENVTELLIKQNNRCFYSGRAFDNVSSIESVSIDRRDPDKGYILSNINLVCSSVNYMKRNLSESEFLNLIYEINKNSVF